jgi:hypothetical protein
MQAMRTDQQKEASRINGTKSRGPVTAEGKQSAARSNLKHGLLSNSVILEGESEQRLQTLHDEIFALLEPEGPLEIALAENMVMCRWRLMRLWVLEAATVNHEIRKQSEANAEEDNATKAALAQRALIDESRQLEVLSRYETRFDRQFSRALQRFNELKTIHRHEKQNFSIEPDEARHPEPTGDF